MAKAKKELKKEYSLKPIEQQMIQVFYNQYMSTLYNFLSFIALERLAYKVTQDTKFNLQGENGLEIWEESTVVTTEDNKAAEAIGEK